MGNGHTMILLYFLKNLSRVCEPDTHRTNELMTKGMTPFTVGEWEAGDYS